MMIPESWFILAEAIRKEKVLALSDSVKAEGNALYARIPPDAKSYPEAVMRSFDVMKGEDRWDDALELLYGALPVLDARLESGEEEIAKWTGKAHLSIGARLLKLDRPKEAIEFATRAVEIGEEYDLSLSNRRVIHGVTTLIYEKLGDFRLAFEHSERRLDLTIEQYGSNPDNPANLDRLAGAHGNLCWRGLFVGEYETAIETGELSV